MTTVFFIRHGPTRENTEARIQGQTAGTLLVEETGAYLQRIVPHLAGYPIAAILSSDLRRAVETRQLLKNFINQPALPEETWSLLRERAMGLYEGTLWDNVPEEYKQQRSGETYNFRGMGGESSSEVQTRVRLTLVEIAQRYPNQGIICVTHAAWFEQVVHLIHHEEPLPDGWSQRTAIYRGEVGHDAHLKALTPLPLY